MFIGDLHLNGSVAEAAMGARISVFVICVEAIIYLLLRNLHDCSFDFLSRSATRKVTRIYHFITNNHASFHLWRKANLLNHQKVSQYYEHDCRTPSFHFFYIKTCV